MAANKTNPRYLADVSMSQVIMSACLGASERGLQATLRVEHEAAARHHALAGGETGRHLYASVAQKARGHAAWFETVAAHEDVDVVVLSGANDGVARDEKARCSRQIELDVAELSRSQLAIGILHHEPHPRAPRGLFEQGLDQVHLDEERLGRAARDREARFRSDAHRAEVSLLHAGDDPELGQVGDLVEDRLWLRARAEDRASAGDDAAGGCPNRGGANGLTGPQHLIDVRRAESEQLEAAPRSGAEVGAARARRPVLGRVPATDGEKLLLGAVDVRAVHEGQRLASADSNAGLSHRHLLDEAGRPHADFGAACLRSAEHARHPQPVADAGAFDQRRGEASGTLLVFGERHWADVVWTRSARGSRAHGFTLLPSFGDRHEIHVANGALSGIVRADLRMHRAVVAIPAVVRVLIPAWSPVGPHRGDGERRHEPEQYPAHDGHHPQGTMARATDDFLGRHGVFSRIRGTLGSGAPTARSKPATLRARSLSRTATSSSRSSTERATSTHSSKPSLLVDREAPSASIERWAAGKLCWLRMTSCCSSPPSAACACVTSA